MVRQEGRVRRVVYPWVSWALRTEPRTMAKVPLWSIACLHCWLRMAKSRSIHLEPLIGREHISKPEHQ